VALMVEALCLIYEIELLQAMELVKPLLPYAEQLLQKGLIDKLAATKGVTTEEAAEMMARARTKLDQGMLAPAMAASRCRPPRSRDHEDPRGPNTSGQPRRSWAVDRRSLGADRCSDSGSLNWPLGLPAPVPARFSRSWRARFVTEGSHRLEAAARACGDQCCTSAHCQG
jgi:hypothetical protein